MQDRTWPIHAVIHPCPYDSRSAQPNAANVPDAFGHPFSLIPRTPIITIAEFLSVLCKCFAFSDSHLILRK